MPFDPQVVDPVWYTIELLIPVMPDTHPLGYHRIRDRLCFWGILIRLVTECSRVTVEAILDRRVSDTTLRSQRDEGLAAGVFDAVRDEAVAACDWIIGLDPSEVGVDRSIHKAPCGGARTGKSPVDGARLGWNWSIAADTNSIPLGWAIDGANRSDIELLEPALDDVARVGLLIDVVTLHLDRGYDFPKIRAQPTSTGLDDLNIQKHKPRVVPEKKQLMRLGPRWVVEGTNSWLWNCGQIHRDTDRLNEHRPAQLCFVTTLLITAKLIDSRDGWSPEPRPIR